jgi:hypothetical protein
MLSDPYNWIGDTLTSVHTSPHDNGMIPAAKRGTSETIIVGNWEREKAVNYGSVSGTFHDKHG